METSVAVPDPQAPPLTPITPTTGTEAEHVTVDGIPLKTLGKGLGPGKQGELCGVCSRNGKRTGYIENKRFSTVVCEDCAGTGSKPEELVCNRCNEQGKYLVPRTGLLVTCRACQGTKVFRHPHYKMRCSTCSGNGNTPSQTQCVTEYLKCSRCNGFGEVPLQFNPAVPENMREQLRTILQQMVAGEQEQEAPATLPAEESPKRKRGKRGGRRRRERMERWRVRTQQTTS